MKQVRLKSAQFNSAKLCLRNLELTKETLIYHSALTSLCNKLHVKELLTVYHSLIFRNMRHLVVKLDFFVFLFVPRPKHAKDLYIKVLSLRTSSETMV